MGVGEPRRGAGDRRQVNLLPADSKNLHPLDCDRQPAWPPCGRRQTANRIPWEDDACSSTEKRLANSTPIARPPPKPPLMAAWHAPAMVRVPSNVIFCMLC